MAVLEALKNIQSSEELCRAVSWQSGGECILAFSRGKDSIAAYYQLRKYFKKIHFYHLYLIPGLSFVDSYLRYWEDRFGVEVLNIPHPSLYRWFGNLVFQAPENCSVLEDMALPMFDFDAIYTLVRQVFGVSEDCPIAQGVRQNDSITRRMSIQKHGAYNLLHNTFFPVFDWSKDQVIESIRDLGVELPYDYRLFGRSFDGIDYRFLEPLSRECPEDFEKVKAFFPLVEAEMFRRRMAEKWAE